LKSLSADEIIRILELTPLVAEGGMLRQTYLSSDRMGEKSACSAIYFLLSGKAFSHLHRLPTDEIYHFYGGDAVEMLRLNPDGSGERIALGTDIAAGQRPQYVMPAGCWQGSRVMEGGEYGLMGTTMAPGFADSDYEHGDKAALLAEYPEFGDMIEKLTGELIYR
jgi:predicted cupin superfamily sugar epimerase